MGWRFKPNNPGWRGAGGGGGAVRGYEYFLEQHCYFLEGFNFDYL